MDKLATIVKERAKKMSPSDDWKPPAVRFGVLQIEDGKGAPDRYSNL